MNAEDTMEVDTAKDMHDGTDKSIGNPFLALPRDIMVHIMNLLQIRDGTGNVDNRTLILFSSCDQYLQNLICNEYSFLWENISFTNPSLQKLTDSQLHGFLERVNAASVTKSLNLHDCPITGTGLIPLMNSRVLETVDLKVDTTRSSSNSPTGLDDAVVAEVLSSMLAYKIETVKLRGPTHPGRLPFAMGDFLIRFSLTKARRAVENCAKCSTCTRLLADVLRCTVQIYSGRNLKEIKCTECKGYSCRPWSGRSACPQIQPCVSCHEPFCDNCYDTCSLCPTTSCSKCLDVLVCESCEEGFCDSCRHVFPCDHCMGFFCTLCSFVQFCDNCYTFGCSECIGPWIPCGICRKSLCGSCKQSDIGHCDLCLEYFCDSCAKVGHCDRCDRRVCAECSEELACDCCTKAFCQHCDSTHHCSSCGRRECWDGVNFHSCDICGTVLCNECLSQCNDCGERRCSSEPPVQQCMFCAVDVCRTCSPAHRCGQCGDQSTLC